MESNAKKSKSINCRELLTTLPAIGILVQNPILTGLANTYPREYIHKVARREVETLRQKILSGEIKSPVEVPAEDEIVRHISERVAEELNMRVKRVINATGILLHTGLGRAPLPESAQKALMEAAERYCFLALDKESGKRGDRMTHLEHILCEISGAEAALVVNNNAAATLLILNTLARDRQVIISRGELVEIGGMFRIPEVMQRAGVEMVEVGTTNKTHLKDYETAITEQTALIVKVHQSNFRIEGFTQDVPVCELAKFAHSKNIPLFYDLGSGALVDLKIWGLPDEPTAPQAISDGADIVSFSGDKLIGGPQSGIIIGKNEFISKMRKNPLLRAIRIDKLIISALKGTLGLFLEPEKLPERHPLYKMMTESLEKVNIRAKRIFKHLKPLVDGNGEIKIIDGLSYLGSGSLPARGLATKLLALRIDNLEPSELARRLRHGSPPVIVRIEDDAVILDARTIDDSEIKLLGHSFKSIMKINT